MSDYAPPTEGVNTPPIAEIDAPLWVKCWVCPDRCPVGDCQRDTRAAEKPGGVA